jgi:hypothetical protein
MDKQHGKATGTCRHLIQDPCFSPSRVDLGSATKFPMWTWFSKGRKKRKFALGTISFFAHGAFAFFALVFPCALALFFALRSRAQKKSERPPLHKLNMASTYPKLFEFEAHFAVFAPLLDSVKTVSASTIDAFLRRTLRCLLSSLAESNTEIVPLSKGILDQNSHVDINSPVSLH